MSEKQPYGPERIDLAGQVALVTGGTTGIGRATALLLAKHGVKVVIFGRHERTLQDALGDLAQTGGDYHGVIADQADDEQVQRVFAETRERFGDIDILINNAALGAGSALEMPYDDILYLMRSNVLGYLSCLRAAVPMMRRKGGGHIVNVGSLSAKERETGSDVYAASKAAVEAMSESLRKLLADDQIRLSLVEPGNIGTNLPGEPADEARQVQMQIQGVALEAEDLAGVIYDILILPPRANVLMLRIAPTRQGL